MTGGPIRPCSVMGRDTQFVRDDRLLSDQPLNCIDPTIPRAKARQANRNVFLLETSETMANHKDKNKEISETLCGAGGGAATGAAGVAVAPTVIAAAAAPGTAGAAAVTSGLAGIGGLVGGGMIAGTMILTGGLAAVALGGAATGYYVAKKINAKGAAPNQ